MKQEIERTNFKVYEMSPYALARNSHGIKNFRVLLTIYDDNNEAVEDVEVETDQTFNLYQFRFDPVLFFTVEDNGETLDIRATRNLKVKNDD